jgi:hypothetical protein
VKQWGKGGVKQWGKGGGIVTRELRYEHTSQDLMNDPGEQVSI